MPPPAPHMSARAYVWLSPGSTGKSWPSDCAPGGPQRTAAPSGTLLTQERTTPPESPVSAVCTDVGSLGRAKETFGDTASATGAATVPRKYQNAPGCRMLTSVKLPCGGASGGGGSARRCQDARVGAIQRTRCILVQRVSFSAPARPKQHAP